MGVDASLRASQHETPAENRSRALGWYMCPLEPLPFPAFLPVLKLGCNDGVDQDKGGHETGNEQEVKNILSHCAFPTRSELMCLRIR
jgi:hypothetical protein